MAGGVDPSYSSNFNLETKIIQFATSYLLTLHRTPTETNLGRNVHMEIKKFGSAYLNGVVQSPGFA